MNFQFWDGMNEQMKPLMEDYFKNRLLEILPERANERNMMKVCEEEYLDTCDKVEGWNAFREEIKKRAGLNE